MITLIKLLKIVLPVATVTTATIFTTSLISFSKKESEKDSENKDKILDDLELKAEEFEEQTMLYSKDGTGESVTLNDDMKEEVMKLLKEKGTLDNLQGLGQGSPDFEKLKKILDSLKNNSSENNTVPKDDRKEEQSLDNKSENSQVQAVKQVHNQPLEVGKNSEETGDSKNTNVTESSEKQGKLVESTEAKDTKKNLSVDQSSSKDAVGDMRSKLDVGKDIENNSLEDQEDSKQTEPVVAKADKLASGIHNASDEGELVGKHEDQTVENRTESTQNTSQQQHQSRNQEPSLKSQAPLKSEDGGRNDVQEVSGGGEETTFGSADGSPKLSEQEVQRWEELFNEISDMSNKLQTLSK